MASRFFDRAVLAVLMTVASLALPAQTPPSDRARADAVSQRVADRIRALQREAEALASQEKTLLVELRKLEVERQLKTEDLAAVEVTLRGTQTKLASTIARAAALRNAADTERPDVEARLVQLYKLGRAGYWRLLLDLDNLQSIGRAYRTASAMTRLDRERVQQHERTLTALAAERKALEAQAKEISRLQDRAVGARAAIDRAVAARTALVESIDVRRDLNAQLIGELEAAQQRLQSAVTQLGPGSPAVNLPLRPFRGALSWPATGIVTGRFGRQSVGRFGTAISRNGIEISLARRSGRPSGARRHDRLCRAVHGLRQPGHPRPRGRRVHALRLSGLHVRGRRGPDRGQRAHRYLGPQPQRQPGAVLRVTRRRQAGRSLTMVEALRS